MTELQQLRGTNLNEWIGGKPEPDTHRIDSTVRCLAKVASVVHDQFHGANNVQDQPLRQG